MRENQAIKCCCIGWRHSTDGGRRGGARQAAGGGFVGAPIAPQVPSACLPSSPVSTKWSLKQSKGGAEAPKQLWWRRALRCVARAGRRSLRLCLLSLSLLLLLWLRSAHLWVSAGLSRALQPEGPRHHPARPGKPLPGPPARLLQHSGLPTACMHARSEALAPPASSLGRGRHPLAA